jgi:hypothetical protein
MLAYNLMPICKQKSAFLSDLFADSGPAAWRRDRTGSPADCPRGLNAPPIKTLPGARSAITLRYFPSKFSSHLP